MKEKTQGENGRRRAESARRVSDIARIWTAERGLAGFTVEELCGEAGISRRTLFNYFASKEDAVLGLPAGATDAHLITEFVDRAAGVPRTAAGLTATLVDDTAWLFRARWEIFSLRREEAHALLAAVEREPKLHNRILEHFQEHERSDIALIERRELLAAGDLRASSLIAIIAAINRLVMEELIVRHEHDETDLKTYTALMDERLAAVRMLMR